MLPRFFAPDAGASASDNDGLITLPDDEAAHLARVLRLKTGDQIRIFDGCGHEWEAAVAEIGRRQVKVRVTSPVAALREPRLAIDVALAVLKGDKMDDVVRDMVMLGVAQIVPLITARTEISLASIQRSGRVARWQRIAVASAKQCGRAVVPPIREPIAFEQFVRQPPAAARLMLVEPAAGNGQDMRALAPAVAAEILIGPEGGWEAGEIREAIACGATPLTLGQLTLRADAAPMVTLTALRTLWNDL